MRRYGVNRGAFGDLGAIGRPAGSREARGGREETRSTAKNTMIEHGIAPVAGGAPNPSSCCCCSSRAFACLRDLRALRVNRGACGGGGSLGQPTGSREGREGRGGPQRNTDRDGHRAGGPGRAEPPLRCGAVLRRTTVPRASAQTTDLHRLAVQIETRRTDPVDQAHQPLTPLRRENVGTLLLCHRDLKFDAMLDCAGHDVDLVLNRLRRFSGAPEMNEWTHSAALPGGKRELGRTSPPSSNLTSIWGAPSRTGQLAQTNLAIRTSTEANRRGGGTGPVTAAIFTCRSP